MVEETLLERAETTLKADNGFSLATPRVDKTEHVLFPLSGSFLTP
jgi:hypothetical protein